MRIGARGNKVDRALRQDGAASRAMSECARRPPARVGWPGILLVLVAAAFSLGACGSISEKMASTLSSMPGIGLPEATPERSDTPRAYPAVHDMPQQRASTVLSEAEQKTMEADLVAVRTQQQSPRSRQRPPRPPPARRPRRRPRRPPQPPAPRRSIKA
jgi:hypothetical protein